jgi:hypothetical protein
MTLKELKEKIAESENNEWFQKYEVKLKYPHINIDLSIKGVVPIYDFILKQIDGYDGFQHLPQELAEVKKLFTNAKNRIIELIKGNNRNDHTWNSHLSPLINNNPKIFLYDSPETDFLIKVSQEQPKYYSGVYEYLIGNTQHATSKEYLIGYLLAYEFVSKDFSLIVERKDAEKKSISTIRADFQKRLGESEAHLTDYLTQANQKFINYSALIDQLKADKEAGYINWFDKTSKGFDQFHTDSNKKIKDLEDLYKEKLKLEAPAKYWSDRAKKLRSEGYKWLAGLIASIVVGIGILIWSLSEISNGTLEKIFQNNGTAIKWSVVFITLISFLAFGIRTFSKLTFSSFHLVRDAEEREQLTYVYLALQKEKAIDQTERHLIMQSLFSRADSGLLKDDASPTMPGNIVDQITKK